MKSQVFFIFILFAMLFNIGYFDSVVNTAGTDSTVLLLNNGKTHNAVIVSTDKGSGNLDRVGNYLTLKDKESPPSEVKVMPKEEIARRFSKVLAASPKKALRFMVYFKPRSKELMEESKNILDDAIDAMKKRSPCTVDVIGHTDTVGSSELNIEVSLKRAKLIESMLKERGVNVVSLVAKGYGEEDLQVETADNVSEAKNRNVEILIK